MQISQLFEILKDLSQGQKSTLTRFIKSNTSQSSQLKLMYDRLRRAKEINQATEKKVRGKEFADSSVYYQYRIALMDLIIRGLVHSDLASSNPFEYIKKAVYFEANELAIKMLLQELQKGIKDGRLGYVVSLLELKSDLEYEFRVSLDFDSKELPEIENAKQEFVTEIGLKGCLDRIREGIKGNPETRERIAVEVERKVLNLTPHTSNIDYLVTKAKIGVHLLRSQFDAANETHSGVIQLILNHKVSLAKGVLIREFTDHVQYGLQSGNRDQVTAGLFHLSKLQTTSPVLQKLKKVHWISNCVWAAETFSDIDLARSIQPELLTEKDSFHPIQWAKMVYILSLAFLYNQEFSEGVKCLSKIKEVPRLKRGDFSWQPSLLKVVLHLELGNTEILDSLINQARADASTCTGDFPKVVLVGLNKLYQLHGSFSTKSTLEEILIRFEQWKLENPMDTNSLYFNFGLWLKSKSFGKSMANIKNEQGSSSQILRTSIS